VDRVGNTITNLTPSSVDSEGIQVWSIQNNAALSITGNNVSNFERGYTL